MKCRIRASHIEYGEINKEIDKMTVLIGRQSSSAPEELDVDLSPDRRVSRLHARIFSEGGSWWLEDLQSTHGTLVGKKPIEKFSYKLSPFVTAIGRQLWPSRYQEDYEGLPDMPQRIRDFLLDVATPISVSQVYSVATGKKSVPSAVMPFFGMPTSKLNKSQTEKLFYERLGRAKTEEEKEKIIAEFEAMGYKYSEKKDPNKKKE